MQQVRGEAVDDSDGLSSQGVARGRPRPARLGNPPLSAPVTSDGERLFRAPSSIVGSCVLLLLAERPGHGYELADRVRGFGFPDSSANSLYRELRRLEEAGLVSSSWQADQARGPARRVYRLTGPGGEALLGCADDAEALGRMLERYVRRVHAARRHL